MPRTWPRPCPHRPQDLACDDGGADRDRWMLAGAAMADIDDEVIDLTQRLVQVDSSNPPGREAGAARLLAEHARRAGLHVRLEELGPERANVTVRLPGTGTDPRTLL